MSNFYGAVVYNDQQLSVLVYNKFDEQQYIVAKRNIFNKDIREVKTQDYFAKIGHEINQTMGAIEDELGIRIYKIDLIVDPNTFYIDAKSFTVNFEEDHIFLVTDARKIGEQAQRYDNSKQGYAVTNFTAASYSVDNVIQKNPVGKKGKVFTVNGELVYVDDATMLPLERIISESRYDLDRKLVSSHLLLYTNMFDNKQAIIEFGRGGMKFVTKNNNLIQNFTTEFGFGHMFEKTYIELLKNFNSEESEAAVRFLQKNFNLKPIKFDFEVVPNLKFSELASIFKAIATEYINWTLKSVEEQGIEIQKIYSIVNGYSNEEWVKFLNDQLNLNAQEYVVTSVIGNFKEDLKVSNAIAVNEKMRLKG